VAPLADGLGLGRQRRTLAALYLRAGGAPGIEHALWHEAGRVGVGALEGGAAPGAAASGHVEQRLDEVLRAGRSSLKARPALGAVGNEIEHVERPVVLLIIEGHVAFFPLLEPWWWLPSKQRWRTAQGTVAHGQQIGLCP